MLGDPQFKYQFLRIDLELFKSFGRQKVNGKGSLVLEMHLTAQTLRALTYYIEGLMKAEHLALEPVKTSNTSSSNLVVYGFQRAEAVGR